MSTINKKSKAPAVKTHEGAPAKRISKMAELRRTVLSCLLWENSFYESGVDVAKRIESLAAECAPQEVADLAFEARTVFKLRHVPLLLINVLTKTGAGIPGLVSGAIARTIQRPDEITELLAIYWKDKRRPLSAQLKKGLAAALSKFNEYSLAKYNRDGKVRLRDVMFLSHAKPRDDAHARLYAKLAADELETPDTWEVALSSGADKKATFERLLREGSLGYLALLRNLRNMEQAGCDRALVTQAILDQKNGAERVLPFRYVAAARAAPSFERMLDTALCKTVQNSLNTLPGRTLVLVDVSGSMEQALSGKSDLKRIDAAATLASIIPGDVAVYTFSNNLVSVPARLGMAGIEAIVASQPHGGTYLGKALSQLTTIPHDRLIVITDEQSHDRVGVPRNGTKAYMINVASYKNGVGYGDGWVHLDGFSENVLTYIRELETEFEKPIIQVSEKPIVGHPMVNPFIFNSRESRG